MFERYTEKARRVIFFARYEASHYGSPDIETEHLLLGLLREDKSLTARFLKTSGALETIRQQIDEHATERDAIPTSIDLPLSKESIQVLNHAAEEAHRLAHPDIGTEHLLLGLLREEKCFASELLAGFDVRLEQVRTELCRVTKDAQNPVADRINQRLAEFGITLPAPPAAGGNYLSAKRVGPMLYLAGVVSTHQGEVITGTAGANKTVEEAYAAARACALTQLAVIVRETGSLDTVDSIVSVNGYVCCVAGFPDSPRVINGASDVLVEIFGDAGRHVRAAVGVIALPRNALVELQMTVLLHE